MTRKLDLLLRCCSTNFCTSFRTLNFAADLLNFTPFFFETFVATFVHFNFPTKRNRWWTISQNGWNSASNMEFSQMWGSWRLSNENILRQITLRHFVQGNTFWQLYFTVFLVCIVVSRAFLRINGWLNCSQDDHTHNGQHHFGMLICCTKSRNGENAAMIRTF